MRVDQVTECGAGAPIVILPAAANPDEMIIKGLSVGCWLPLGHDGDHEITIRWKP